MLTWPLLHKNKVEDSKVSVPVTLYAQSENETIKVLAQSVRPSQALVLQQLTSNQVT
jgi:hypothetical protein